MEQVGREGVRLPPQAGPTMLAKQEDQDLLKRVRACREEPGLWSLRQLLQLRLAKLDRKLRQCPPAEFLKMQAEAAMYESLIEEIFIRTA